MKNHPLGVQSKGQQNTPKPRCTANGSSDGCTLAAPQGQGGGALPTSFPRGRCGGASALPLPVPPVPQPLLVEKVPSKLSSL